MGSLIGQIASGAGFALAMLAIVREVHIRNTGDIADDIAWSRSQHERIDQQKHGRDT